MVLEDRLRVATVVLRVRASAMETAPQSDIPFPSKFKNTILLLICRSHPFIIKHEIDYYLIPLEILLSLTYLQSFSYRTYTS